MRYTKMWVVIILLLNTISLIMDSELQTSAENIITRDRRDSVNKKGSKTSYVPYSPIYIDSNDDFKTMEFKGSGTVNNPYVIENLKIEDASTNLIDIAGTTVYVVIQNNLLNNLGGSSISINLNNVESCIIRNNIISNGVNAIKSYQSKDIKIESNSISETRDKGIHLISSSDNNIIINNSIRNTKGEGIEIYDCTGNIIVNNSIFNSDNDGITLVSSHEHSILYNNINTTDFGIKFVSVSSYNLISNNSISKTRDFGIYLEEGSNYNIVTWNNLRENNQYGNSQAYGTTTNSFDYNYWDDWTSPDVNEDGIVDNPYLINAGYEEIYDLHPLVLPNSLTTGLTLENATTSEVTDSPSSPIGLEPLSILIALGIIVVIQSISRKR
ncbi:MAG: NosD domain-containing protein [Promethearchaeota archaeon]